MSWRLQTKCIFSDKRGFVSITMLTVFLSTLLVTSALWWLYKSRKPESLPPGPMSLPVLGGVWSIGGGDTRDAFRRMSQKYGDIFTLDLGRQRTIVLASYASIREALVNKGTAFSGRPATSFVKDAGLENGIMAFLRLCSLIMQHIFALLLAIR